MIRQLMILISITVTSYMLAASAYRHIDNSYYFLSTIYSYKIVDEVSGHYIANFLPVFQLILVIALLFDKRARITAFSLSTSLFSLFLIAQLSTLVRGLKINCGCFGSADETLIGTTSISVAIIGLLFSTIGILLCRSNTSEKKP